MRLVCPSCEAKYEVPDDAIPDTGRDVQCANCGHAWFQMRGRTAAVATDPEPEAAAPVAVKTAPVEDTLIEAPVAEAADTVPAEPEADPLPEEVPPATPAEEPAPEPEAQPDPAPVEMPEDTPAELPEAVALAADPAEDIDGDESPEAAAAAAAALETEAVSDAKAGYAVDESVLAILREEAERETNARRAEVSKALEVQTDLGIESAVAAKAVSTAVDTETAEDKPSARRDLFPDVEEINSTLRPSEAGEEPEFDEASAPLPAAERSGGFRSGFLMVMTVAMIGAGIYMSAPTLARLVPSLTGPLESYVGMVNGLRLELDGLMRSATVALNGT